MEAFLVMVFLISLSGVMLPGPLFASLLRKGMEDRWAGFKAAVGHSIVEIPLILIIYFGVASFMNREMVKALSGILGGIFLIYLSIPRKGKEREIARNPILLGTLLSALNPLFIMWWLTVGLRLITEASSFGIKGIAFFIPTHLSTDFIWLPVVSLFSSRLGRSRVRTVLLVVSSLLLLCFGIRFIVISTQVFLK